MKKAQIHIKIDNVVKDQSIIESILAETCEKFQLFDNTKTSRVPQTIKSIVEREHYGFGFGARIVEKLIIVDFSPRNTHSPIFNDIYNFVVSKLFLAFSDRVKEANETEFISLYDSSRQPMDG